MRRLSFHGAEEISLPQDFLQDGIQIWKRAPVAELWKPVETDDGVQLSLCLFLLVREQRHRKYEHHDR
jgi:hypothetical protein